MKHLLIFAALVCVGLSASSQIHDALFARRMNVMNSLYIRSHRIDSIATDPTLGGVTSSHIVLPTQKAVRDFASNASNLSTGTIPQARLGITGTPDGTKVLWDDFSWKLPSNMAYNDLTINGDRTHDGNLNQFNIVNLSHLELEANNTAAVKKANLSLDSSGASIVSNDANNLSSIRFVPKGIRIDTVAVFDVYGKTMVPTDWASPLDSIKTNFILIDSTNDDINSYWNSRYQNPDGSIFSTGQIRLGYSDASITASRSNGNVTSFDVSDGHIKAEVKWNAANFPSLDMSPTDIRMGMKSQFGVDLTSFIMNNTDAYFNGGAAAGTPIPIIQALGSANSAGIGVLAPGSKLSMINVKDNYAEVGFVSPTATGRFRIGTINNGSFTSFDVNRRVITLLSDSLTLSGNTPVGTSTDSILVKGADNRVKAIGSSGISSEMITGSTTYSTNTSAVVGDLKKLIKLSGASGTVTYTIAPGTFTNKTFYIKCTDATNTVTVSFSSGTIDGLSSVQLLANETLVLFVDGTNGYILNH